MLLHVRIDTSGRGRTSEQAHEDAENNILHKNRAIESLTDPSVDPSPDTRPTLTCCNRRVVYGKGVIKRFRWPLPKGGAVCETCLANPLTPSGYANTYLDDEQTAPM
jgi:hypothetical protein